MNTLEDLRATLGHQADAVHDADRYARPFAVRERIRVVRRRRTAVTAVAAAVLVVAGVAVAGTLSRPDPVQPAGPTVADVRVPVDVTVTGFPYRLDESASSVVDDGRLHLAASDADRAVSLVGNGLGSGFATLFLDGEAIARVGAGENVAAPMRVPVLDEDVTLRVRFDDAPARARAGVAVYRATGQLADGVTNGTAVFRDTVDESTLVAAAFSEPGRPRATVHFSGRVDQMRIGRYCSSTAPGLWLHVVVDGQVDEVRQCVHADDRDPGAFWFLLPGHDGGAHTLRAYLTRGRTGPVVDSGDAVVGVGVYGGVEWERILGVDLPRTIEYRGRTWALDRIASHAEDARDVAVDTTDGDRLLGLVAEGRQVWASWDGRLLDGESIRVGSTVGAGWTVAGLLPRGDRYQVRLRSAGGGSVHGALLVYRPA